MNAIRSLAEHERRVVITGIGVIAPNGATVETFWNAVRGGRSAVDHVRRFNVGESPCKLSAEIRGFNPVDYMDAKTAKRF